MTVSVKNNLGWVFNGKILFGVPSSQKIGLWTESELENHKTDFVQIYKIPVFQAKVHAQAQFFFNLKNQPPFGLFQKV